ncbi:B2 protein-like [Cylas formicarius]|uniref:Odorant binding protein n=1 Tax=Cylas formicarius TaxID=197179 RepID=A0A6B7M5T0_CYLFO|nr:B2 protein-like [Cylas formicarius]QFO46777.1 odorant binding protein [Cylas formicarius]
MRQIIVLGLALTAVLAIPLTDEQKQKLSDVHGRCQNDPVTHIDDSIFEKLRKREHVELPSNFAAHELCMSKGVGLINEDGSVNKEMLRKSISHSGVEESKVEEIVNQCGENQETPEKTAIHLRKCLLKHAVQDHVAHHGHVHEHSHAHH